MKWTIVSFEDFQILTVELQNRINMLSGKLNLYQDSVKNETLRQIAYITNTIQDKQYLEEHFWPTKSELSRNKRKNKAARQWLIDHRL